MSTCADCKFAKMASQGGQIALQCRYEPPTIHAAPNERGQFQFVAMWPAVESTAWCGKYTEDTVARRTQ